MQPTNTEHYRDNVSAASTGAAPAVLAMTFYVDVVVCNTVKQKIVCDGVTLIADDHYVSQGL
jgi:hypothetical protein